MGVGCSGAKRSEPLLDWGCGGDWVQRRLWVRRLLVRRLLVRRLLVWGGITAFLAHIYLAEGGGCQCSKMGCQCSKRGCQPIGTL